MSNRLKKIIKTLKTLEKEVKNKYKAEVVGVFGSYVRGEQRRYSDIDILVKFFEGATLLDLVGLADFLEKNLNVKIDIVPVDTIRKEIKQRVLKEAVYL